MGEILSCKREKRNASDPYAVAVIKAENEEDAVVIVGHVPRKISAACSLFLGREGSSIICTVCGDRRYSSDFPQGGLEVPCKLIFKGSKENVGKMKKLLTGTSSTTSTSTDTSSPPSKRRKIVDCDSVKSKDHVTERVEWTCSA